jgi:hypothetical protein
VHRLLGEQQQDRGADVTARCAATPSAATVGRPVVQPGVARVTRVVVAKARMSALVSVHGVHDVS